MAKSKGGSAKKPKKRGLSPEEKMAKLLKFFVSRNDCFSIKELEKVAPKATGIAPMQMKSILQMLLDDDLVETDKIGIGVFYWSFPSKSAQTLRVRKAEAEANASKMADEISELEEEKDNLASERMETKDRTKVMQNLREARKQNASLQEEIANYAEFDPAVFAARSKAAGLIRAGANRWTDNVYTLRDYCHSKFNMDKKDFDRGFGLTADFDYYDE